MLPTSLFGDAAILTVPAAFQDARELREVPMNQEVFINKESLSIIVEVLEPPTGRLDHDDQVKYYLLDLLHEKNTDLAWTEQIRMLGPEHDKLSSCVTTISHPEVDLGLIRISDPSVDILISMSKPNTVFVAIVDSFEITDWTPFRAC